MRIVPALTYLSADPSRRPLAAITRTPTPDISPAMLESFTMETFQPRLGEIFYIVAEGEHRLPTRLTAVSPWGAGAPAGRDRIPFSLVFHTVPQNTVLPQMIYRVENENMEPMDLFLAPLGPDERGMRYEAVFT